MKFTIPIEPVGQMRARHTSAGKFSRTYKAKQQTAENRLLAFAVEHRPDTRLTVRWKSGLTHTCQSQPA